MHPWVFTDISARSRTKIDNGLRSWLDHVLHNRNQAVLDSKEHWRAEQRGSKKTKLYFPGLPKAACQKLQLFFNKKNIGYSVPPQDRWFTGSWGRCLAPPFSASDTFNEIGEQNNVSHPAQGSRRSRYFLYYLSLASSRAHTFSPLRASTRFQFGPPGRYHIQSSPGCSLESTFQVEQARSLLTKRQLGWPGRWI